MVTIQKNINLQPYTTFGLPARAAFYGELNHENELPDLFRQPEFHPDTVLWLGGGSNIVFLHDYPHLVIRLNNKGIREISRENDRVLIQAEAGENWHQFVQHTLDLGLSGLENLSLIPGTVGAAPVQNIGAYGVEVGERVHGVRCYDFVRQDFVELSREECAFAYRDSIFKRYKKRYLIVSVIFSLSSNFILNARYGDLASVLAAQCPDRAPTAKDVAQAVCQIRREKLPDPARLGNVGSFYQNPIINRSQADDLLEKYPEMPHYPQADGAVKLAAGWLIEQCGLKSHAVGGAAVHDKQALVLVNRGGARADDVHELSRVVCARVAARFGVHLQIEPLCLPNAM